MNETWRSWLSGTPWLLMIGCFFILPLAGLLLMSFSGEGGFPSLDNYRVVLGEGSDRPAVLLRTIGTALSVVLFSIAIAVPAAYYLAKCVLSARVQAAVLALVAVTFLVGPLVRTVAWRGILGRSGLVNTVLQGLGVIDEPIMALLYGRSAVIVAMTYNAFPFMLFTVFLAMKMIDDRYLAAGRDLGAGPAAVFWRIVLPLAAPGIWTGAILVFVPTISTVLEPEILGGTLGRLAATEIRDQFFHALNWPMGSTLTIVLIVAGGVAILALALVTAALARLSGRIGIAMRAGATGAGGAR